MENSQIEKGLPLEKITWQSRLYALYTYAYLTVVYYLSKLSLRRVGMNASPVWWFSATLWGGVSYLIISDYLRYGNANDLNQIWLLCSLLWAQFGLAGAFSALTKGEMNRVPDYLFQAVFPPLLLHFILSSIV